MKASVPRVVVASGLDGWETQWDRLVDLSPLPSPFLRSWWLTGAGGPRRRFLLAVDGERLIGGLALEAARWPGLEVLHLMGGGYLCPDHLDLLAGPTEEDVTIGLLRDWFQRPGGRLLDLEGVPGHSRLIEALPSPARLVPLAIAPWTPLPDDSKAYFAGLPSHLRRNIRRATTRLTEDGVADRPKRGPSAVEALETLRTMHQAQWGGRSRFLSRIRSVRGGLPHGGRGR